MRSFRADISLLLNAAYGMPPNLPVSYLSKVLASKISQYQEKKVMQTIKAECTLF